MFVLFVLIGNSSDLVEKSLSLDEMDSIPIDEHPDGGGRIKSLISLSIEDRLEVDLDDSELPSEQFSFD